MGLTKFKINKKLILSVAAVSAAVLLIHSVISYVRTTRPSAIDVRVSLVRGADRVDVSSKVPWRLTDPVMGKVLIEAETPLAGTGVSVKDGGISLGKQKFSLDKVLISPVKGYGIGVNGVLYRGDIEVIKKEDGLDVINNVGIEDYLKGVLPREVYSFWPSAVIRAQAIAARSFAAHRARQRRDKAYDLRADTVSQVYGGASSESLRTSRAVNVTNGQVLEYDGKIFPAYYHACCGGYTESADILWGEDLAPLEGGRCIWCRISPYYRWKKRVDTRKILEKFQAGGYDIKRVDDIRTAGKDASGRMKDLKMRSGRKWYDIKTADFRKILGSSVLRSAKFSVKKYPRFYLFDGYGWGHGAGMCQWGAFGMALMRFSTKSILKKYYPGAKIVDLRDLVGKNKIDKYGMQVRI